MAVVYPLSFPSGKNISKATINHNSIIGMTQSTFTGKQYIQEHLGKFWSGELVWPSMKRIEASEIISFLRKLDGRKGTFLMELPNTSVPRGSAATTPGSPLVMGGSQTGLVITLEGLPSGVSGYLLEDDAIQLGTGIFSRVHTVVNDVNVNGSGEATIDIWPNIRTAPADGEPVIVSGALGHWRLNTNVTTFNLDEAAIYGIDVSIIEAF